MVDRRGLTIGLAVLALSGCGESERGAASGNPARRADARKVAAPPAPEILRLDAEPDPVLIAALLYRLLPPPPHQGVAGAMAGRERSPACVRKRLMPWAGSADSLTAKELWRFSNPDAARITRMILHSLPKPQEENGPAGWTLPSVLPSGAVRIGGRCGADDPIITLDRPVHNADHAFVSGVQFDCSDRPFAQIWTRSGREWTPIAWWSGPYPVNVVCLPDRRSRKGFVRVWSPLRDPRSAEGSSNPGSFGLAPPAPPPPPPSPPRR
ncbi:hypothetical protein [Allosphingosinicella deserti]|uniref:Uncharacterized protein n=1 Tax=Allosphingosinicella deserti TaxID=2116704 RepID=A0A2P7QRI9_9SPHN|nr:hypothetical protein [Sphingomonas deserti]PSJ40581.1 hypothetical protein C7I55_09650 [Sphingomonas deserti]